MKYTVRHVKRFLEQKKIDPSLWAEHFPSLIDTRVPACTDCEDYKKQICEGKKNPVDCFLAIKPEPDREHGTPAGEGAIRKKPKTPRWARTAPGKSKPPKADKTYDQSKM